MKKSEIVISFGKEIDVKGNLTIPEGANSLVIFSHGSGSSRFSVRNRYVADLLNKHNIATLLADLLTEKEDLIYENRFNIDLLTARLVALTKLVRQRPELENLKVGYFGASTGAASALKAAALFGNSISAVVSRGGRPDLAREALTEVTAPTLLLVGSLDDGVIDLNEQAYDSLRCEKRIEIIKGATHLFEEPGKLDEVAGLAASWFEKYLKANPVLTSI
jgi:putative phosphoribosyl transferase